LFLFYESTTGMVPIMGPKQTLCTRAQAPNTPKIVLLICSVHPP